MLMPQLFTVLIMILFNRHMQLSLMHHVPSGLAPIVRKYKHTIKSGLMNTIHSFTNDRPYWIIFIKIFVGKTASSSMVPTKTGAASAVGLVIPELKGKLDGVAIRVPTTNVSLVDITLNIEEKVTAEEVNAVVKKAAVMS